MSSKLHRVFVSYGDGDVARGNSRRALPDVPLEGRRRADTSPAARRVGPARRLAIGGKRTFTPRANFEKAFGRITVESLLELAMADQMEADDDVANFRPQPVTFIWSEHARRRCYTPDFAVFGTDGGLAYREVKPRGVWLRDPTLRGRRDAIAEECRHRGARFEVWVDVEPRPNGPVPNEFGF
ncbi:hypothetical protein ACLNGM_21655 [Aureimonas phyllosphaerae]|uniref:hypothetical protein n=1 Tax=Aureimonas phyllosphaerae TaxID=1166078 RepID=UPI003A5BC4EA